MGRHKGATGTLDSMKGRVPPFIANTYRIVMDSGTAKVVRWNKGGDAILVFSKEQMAKSVLPKYFKTRSFESFVRQLNFYGFRKQGNEQRSTCCFAHPDFKRGRVARLEKIKKRRSIKKEVLASSFERIDDLEDELTRVHARLDSFERFIAKQSTMIATLNKALCVATGVSNSSQLQRQDGHPRSIPRRSAVPPGSASSFAESAAPDSRIAGSCRNPFSDVSFDLDVPGCSPVSSCGLSPPSSLSPPSGNCFTDRGFQGGRPRFQGGLKVDSDDDDARSSSTTASSSSGGGNSSSSPMLRSRALSPGSSEFMTPILDNLPPMPQTPKNANVAAATVVANAAAASGLANGLAGTRAGSPQAGRCSKRARVVVIGGGGGGSDEHGGHGLSAVWGHISAIGTK